MTKPTRIAAVVVVAITSALTVKNVHADGVHHQPEIGQMQALLYGQHPSQLHVAPADSLLTQARTTASQRKAGFTTLLLGTRAPAQWDASQLRLPDATFDPATVVPSYDYGLSAASADAGPFRQSHYWSYTRMGMQAGYYELAGAMTNGGDSIAFGWQASTYGSTAQATAAFKDGYARASGWGQSSSCTKTLQMPCALMTYSNNNGDTAQLTIFQYANCLGEVKTVAAPDIYQVNVDQISTTGATIDVVGSHTLQNVCHGGAGSSTPAQTSHSAPVKSLAPTRASANGFHGNCFTYRGDLWSVATVLGKAQNVWWNDLQVDYNGNYPPPSGGSDPGVTQGQFDAASADMAKIDTIVGTDAEGLLAATGIKFGVKNINAPDPYSWAMNRVFGAAYHLDLAAKAEMKTPASGLDDFHLSQSLLSNSWDALKQLPCH